MNRALKKVANYRADFFLIIFTPINHSQNTLFSLKINKTNSTSLVILNSYSVFFSSSLSGSSKLSSKTSLAVNILPFSIDFLKSQRSPKSKKKYLP